MKQWSAFAMAGLFLFSLGFVVKTNWLDKPLRPLPKLLLRFELKSDTTGQALILFNNSQGGYFPIQRSDVFQPVTLSIPETPSPLWGIRLEPLQGRGAFALRNIVISDESGGVIKSIDAGQHIESLNSRTAVTVADGELRVTTATEQDRAVLLFKGIFPVRTAVDNLPRVTPWGLVVAWLVLGGIVTGLLFKVVRVAVRDGKAVILWVSGVFLTVLGVRLMCLLFYSVSFQHWDPWDHEAWNLYLPYMDGGLS